MPHLVKQKSKTQLLANRKKSLENRLLATREILKLQNEHIIGAGGGGGESGSPLLKAKPISFSQAMKMVSAQINSSKEQQQPVGSFHSIVDQYVAQKREEQGSGFASQWGSPMALPSRMTGGVVGSGGVGGVASSPLLTSSHKLGSGSSSGGFGGGPGGGAGGGAVGRSRKYGFCLQAPRHPRGLGGQGKCTETPFRF